MGGIDDSDGNQPGHALRDGARPIGRPVVDDDNLGTLSHHLRYQ